jgi:hypothetical protein
MGSLFSGSQKTTSKTEPWKPQGDALQGIFSSAGDIYNSQKDTPFYQGDLYAGMSDMTRGGINTLGQYVGGPQSQQIQGATSGMLGNAGMTGTAMNDIYGLANSDMVGNDLAAATRYANDPAMQGIIDAANRDTARSLYEGELPEINRNASASGNINSTRAGVAEAIARRGADDRMADTSAAIRSDAFNRGLGLSQANRNAQFGALSNLGQFGLSSFGAGLNGNNANLGNIDALIRGGQIDQADRQGALDADYMRWQGQDTRASDLLSRYYGIVGANNWGGTSTQKTKSSPSIFSVLAGGASTAAGLGFL